MIFALAVAATAAASTGQYTAPVAINSGSWIVPVFDWPSRGVPRGTYTAVAVELTVNEHGGVAGCKVTGVLGSSGMGDYTCKLLRVRARFEPARDPSGKRLYGVYRNRIIWTPTGLPEGWHPPPYISYKVTVDRLPPGQEEPALTTIQFAVDKNGQASACSSNDKIDPDLAKMACDRLGPVFRSEPARDRQGRAMDSVQNANVQLIPG